MDDGRDGAIEGRIERFLVCIGAAMTLGAATGWGIRAGVSAAIGTAICWLNFRWLRHGAAALIRLGQAQATAENPRVPPLVHVKYFGRLLLLLLVAYVTVVWLRLAAIAFLCGLVAVVPAIVLELGYELIHGHHRWKTQ